jgi:hypothetical protein
LYYIFNQLDEEDTTDFFERLTSGKNLDEGNPILVLRNTVLEHGPIHSTDRMRLAALMIKAWNFYRSGIEVQRLRWKGGGAKPEQFPKPV